MASRILAGRYELLEKIGEGGMAVVFKSRDRLLNRFVAIKILRPEFTKDAVFIESFKRESQMAAGLSHPNIVNIFDVGKEGNIYYIVMELMEGTPLSDIIKKEGALEPQRAATIARQIASALSAAHKNNLIHRDVKPHNIMFAADGAAKIADFGIAKKVTGETLVTEQKKENVMGSVHYFSPEQARGAYVDAKSDIYSLGICLYEMLTGKVPFDGETAVEVAVKHMNEEMVPPKQVNPNIPQDLEDIVLKATNKNPANRFNNMDEMITALNFVSYGKHHQEAPVEILKEEDEVSEFEPLVSNDDFLIGKEAKAEEVISEEPKKEIERAPRVKKEKPKKTRVKKEEPKEETEGEKKSFFLSPQRYIAVILAIILALGLSAGIFKLATREKPENIVEVSVPKITDMTVEEATKALEKEGLKLEVELELVSKDVPEGVIMSQTPSEGSVVKSDQTVRVNISKGYTPGSVPNVTGKSITNAKTVLESYGYRVVTGGYQQNDTIEKDYVISQNPKSGTTLEQGSTVTLVLSSGAGEADQLDIIGKTYAEAVEILQDAEYSVGARFNQKSNDVEEGCVIKYNIHGNQVDLYVSSGKGGGGTGDTTIDGYIQFNFSFDGIEVDTDAFTAKVSIVDDNGSRTVNETCVYAEGEKTLLIGGSGTDCEVTIVAETKVFQLHHVNFQTGYYE